MPIFHRILLLLMGAPFLLTACQMSDPQQAEVGLLDEPQLREPQSPGNTNSASGIKIVTTGGAPSASLVETINSGTLRLIPRVAGKPAFHSNELFTSYVRPRPNRVTWSKGWTSKIDLTGVAWEKPQSLTMVSPRHGLMAAHYIRKVGSTVVFHDKAGIKVSCKVAASRRVRGVDISVALLDKELPARIAHYRVLKPSPSYGAALPGAYALITNQFRKIQIHSIRKPGYAGYPGYSGISFGKAEGLPDACYQALVKGDSGNPAFIWLRGEPIFIETHSSGGGGAGPFLSSPKTFEGINAAMKKLSEMHSAPVYQLNVVTP